MSFPIDGIWWLPNQPTVRVPGRLEIGDTRHPDLVIFQNFPDAPDAHVPVPHPIDVIHGQDWGGKRYTILNASRFSSKQGPEGFVDARYIVEAIYEGGNEPGTPRFDLLAVTYSGLGYWFPDDGFKQTKLQSGGGVSIRYRRPPREHWATELGAMTLRRGVNWEMSFGRRYERLEEIATFEIRFPKPLTSSEVNHAVVLPWQGFLSFCTGISRQPNAVALRSSKRTPGESRVLLRPIHGFGSYRASDARITPDGIRLPWSFVVANAYQPLQAWMALSPDKRQIMNGLLAAAEVEDMFPEQRFQLLIQALEAYHRTLSRSMPVAKTPFKALRAQLTAVLDSALPSDTAETIKMRLGNLNTVSLTDHLLQTLKELEVITGQEIADPEQAAQLGKLRNKLAHGAESQAASSAYYQELSLYTRILADILTLCIMRMLGLKDDSIYALSRKSWRQTKS